MILVNWQAEIVFPVVDISSEYPEKRCLNFTVLKNRD